MTRRHAVLLASALFLLGLVATPRVAAAQKAGGVMKVYFFDSPATMSIDEESTIAGQGPMMGVFNNLVMYDPNVPQSGLDSIVPDLATGWSWDDPRTRLSFKLRPRRALARRQAVHRARRQLRLRPAAGPAAQWRDPAGQSAQGVVRQPRRGRGQGRRRGGLPVGCAA